MVSKDWGDDLYLPFSSPPLSLIFTEPSCAARCIKATSDQLHQSREFMSKRKSVRLREGGEKKNPPWSSLGSHCNAELRGSLHSREEEGDEGPALMSSGI